MQTKRTKSLSELIVHSFSYKSANREEAARYLMDLLLHSKKSTYQENRQYLLEIACHELISREVRSRRTGRSSKEPSDPPGPMAYPLSSSQFLATANLDALNEQCEINTYMADTNKAKADFFCFLAKQLPAGTTIEQSYTAEELQKIAASFGFVLKF